MIDFLYHLSADQWAALGQWAGAIGTFWAVIVSLRLAREAKLNSSPRLSIESSPSYKGTGSISLDLKIVNVGFVPTTIVSGSVRKRGIWGPGKVIKNNLAMKEHFPLRIEPGQSYELEITAIEFIWMKNIVKIKSGLPVELILVDSLNNVFRHKFKTPNN